MAWDLICGQNPHACPPGFAAQVSPWAYLKGAMGGGGLAGGAAAIIVGGPGGSFSDASEWVASNDDLDYIFDNYPPEISQGVEWMIDRFNEGATDHALNGIGQDAKGTAEYLSQERASTFQDARTSNPVFYDSENEILIIRSPGGGLHGYNFSRSQWSDAVADGTYVPMQPGVNFPAGTPADEEPPAPAGDPVP